MGILPTIGLKTCSLLQRGCNLKPSVRLGRVSSSRDGGCFLYPIFLSGQNNVEFPNLTSASAFARCHIKIMSRSVGTQKVIDCHVFQYTCSLSVPVEMWNTSYVPTCEVSNLGKVRRTRSRKVIRSRTITSSDTDTLLLMSR